MANSLPSQITQAAGAPATIRVGTISSTSPLVLTIQGASFSGASVGVLGSYVPQLGDTVQVAGQSKAQGSDPSSWVILGSSNPLTENGSVPQVRAWQSVVQNIADATNVAITFTNQQWDTHAIHSSTVNTSQFVAPKDGRYLVIGNLGWAINATGRRNARLLKNGVTSVAETGVQAVTGSFTFQNVISEVDLVVGDYMELIGTQLSGAPINTFAGGPQFTWMSMRWLNASVGLV